MVAKKKPSIITAGAVAGSILAIVGVGSFAFGIIDKGIEKKIDSRIECNTRYLVILMQEIATPEQKERADKEYQRWNK